MTDERENEFSEYRRLIMGNFERIDADSREARARISKELAEIRKEQAEIKTTIATMRAQFMILGAAAVFLATLIAEAVIPSFFGG